jgi:hypothetical protein
MISPHLHAESRPEISRGFLGDFFFALWLSLSNLVHFNIGRRLRCENFRIACLSRADYGDTCRYSWGHAHYLPDGLTRSVDLIFSCVEDFALWYYAAVVLAKQICNCYFWKSVSTLNQLLRLPMIDSRRGTRDSFHGLQTCIIITRFSLDRKQDTWHWCLHISSRVILAGSFLLLRKHFIIVNWRKC